MADEYLEGIMNREPKSELARRPEWTASLQGFPIYIDPDLAPGWVKFLDKDGRIIGMISDVGKIYLADKRAP
jgi:hypothetical protein